MLLMLTPVPAAAASFGRLRIAIRDEGGGAAWARVQVRDSKGEAQRSIENGQVIWDRTAKNFPGTRPYYTDDL